MTDNNSVNVGELETEAYEEAFLENENEELDFTLVKESKAKMKGRFEVVIEKVELKRTKESNKRMANVSFRVRKDIEQKYRNKVVFGSYVLDNEAGMKRFVELCKACGLEKLKVGEIVDTLPNIYCAIGVDTKDDDDNPFIIYHNKSKVGEVVVKEEEPVVENQSLEYEAVAVVDDELI